MEKLHHRELKTLSEFMEATGGIAAASDWTNGSGRFVTKRQLPRFCKEMLILTAVRLPGKSGKLARAMRKDRPRVLRVVVVVDWRKVNRALKEATN
tara:strand:- start:602 stop:889 length:288 start_codon:yes stop_codon:yes gene_type:complete